MNKLDALNQAIDLIPDSCAGARSVCRTLLERCEPRELDCYTAGLLTMAIALSADAEVVSTIRNVRKFLS